MAKLAAAGRLLTLAMAVKLAVMEMASREAVLAVVALDVEAKGREAPKEATSGQGQAV